MGIVYFTMNFNKEPFQDVRVRKAVQMSIDRQAILDALYGGRGQVEQGIFPHGLIGFNPDQEEIKYDPEAAKALLAEAGYADGFDMEIAADSSASDTMTMALEIVSDQLAEVGIRAEIKNYDESTWLETRKSGELGSFMSTWSADYNDPDNFIYTFFGNEEKTRIRSINYPDTEVMERVAKARTIVNEDERLAEYKALEENEVRYEAIECDDADYVIVAFGSSARICSATVEMARAEGIRLGMLRPITLYPFPKKQLAEMAARGVKGFLSAELNAGQMVEDVRLAVNGKAPVEHYGRQGGMMFNPDEVLDALKEKLIKK